MKLGYSNWGMPTVPLEVAIPHLARLGYEGIEITAIPKSVTALEERDAAARQRLRDLLVAHRMALPAIAAHSSLIIDDPPAYAIIHARLQGAIDLAVDLAAVNVNGPAVITVGVGGRSSQFVEPVRARLVDRLEELIEYASARGVTIAIEPHVGGMIDRPERVLWLLDRIRSPYLKVNFDDSHFAVQGIPLSETVPALAPHTVHTHVQDHRGRAPEFEFVVNGEGEYDLPSYLRAMHQAGYDGFVTVEVSVMVQQKPGYDPLATAVTCYERVAQAMEAARVRR